MIFRAKCAQCDYVPGTLFGLHLVPGTKPGTFVIDGIWECPACGSISPPLLRVSSPLVMNPSERNTIVAALAHFLLKCPADAIDQAFRIYQRLTCSPLANEPVPPG